MTDKIWEVFFRIRNTSEELYPYTQARQQLSDVVCGEIEKERVTMDEFGGDRNYLRGYLRAITDIQTLIKQLLLTPKE